MTILVLTHSYPDKTNRWRGVFIQEQVKVLSLNHDIIVVYFKADYSHFAPFSDYLFLKTENGPITEYEVTINKSFPVLTQLKYLSNTYRFIEKEILSNRRIDLIHSHLSYPAGFLGTIIQKRKKIPNILTEHSWIKKYFRTRIHKMCVLYTLKNSFCIISVSNALKADIRLFCRRDVIVVANVIDVNKFHLSKVTNSGTINLGMLGAMGNFRKGFDILLKAVSLIDKMDLVVHIGGAGKYLEKYKTLAKELGVFEKCIFYGEIPPSDIINFYLDLDFYVLASRDETFGVVIVEAMSCGLPVIATKCGGPEEIITSDTGILVEKEDPVELSKAITYLSQNPGVFDRESIRNYVLGKYGQKIFSERITRLYDEMISSFMARN